MYTEVLFTGLAMLYSEFINILQLEKKVQGLP